MDKWHAGCLDGLVVLPELYAIDKAPQPGGQNPSEICSMP